MFGNCLYSCLFSCFYGCGFGTIKNDIIHLVNSAKYEEALYEEALDRIQGIPNYYYNDPEILHLKVYSLNRLERYKEALQCQRGS